MTRTTGMAAIAAVLLLAGCGSDPDAGTGVDQIPAAETATETQVQTSACEIAFADAAAVDSGQDTLEDLWPAFDACADLAEFTQASKLHPDALDGTDPQTYATNQCTHEPEVADTPVCADVSGS